MSTSYGFFCVPCDEESPLYFNGNDTLETVYALRSAVREIERHPRVGITLEYDGYCGYRLSRGDPTPAGWLVEHDGHAIKSLDEYGRLAELDGVE